jgi:hypothetical protein
LGPIQSAYADPPSPPTNYDPTQWSGFVVDYTQQDLPDDPNIPLTSYVLEKWNSLTVYDFSAHPGLTGTSTGNIYTENEAAGIICSHRTTLDETYPLTPIPDAASGGNPGYVNWPSPNSYVVESATATLPITYTDTYTLGGDPFYCTVGTFTTESTQSFPFNWSVGQGTYTPGDTTLQGTHDVPFRRRLPRLASDSAGA